MVSIEDRAYLVVATWSARYPWIYCKEHREPLSALIVEILGKVVKGDAVTRKFVKEALNEFHTSRHLSTLKDIDQAGRIHEARMAALPKDLLTPDEDEEKKSNIGVEEDLVKKIWEAIEEVKNELKPAKAVK